VRRHFAPYASTWCQYNSGLYMYLITGDRDRGAGPTSAHRLLASSNVQNVLENNPRHLSLLDQAVAPRARLPPEERVRPEESALARWAMTCSGGGRFSGEPSRAVGAVLVERSSWSRH
jgi:hypothetical protein